MVMENVREISRKNGANLGILEARVNAGKKLDMACERSDWILGQGLAHKLNIHVIHPADGGGQMPTAVLKALGIPRPAVPTRQAEQIATDKQSQRKDLCIACDTALPLGDTRTQHPLVEGAVCEDCRENLLESLFAIALDERFSRCIESKVKLWLQDKLGEVQLNKVAEGSEEYYTRQNLLSTAVRVQKEANKDPVDSHMKAAQVLLKEYYDQLGNKRTFEEGSQAYCFICGYGDVLFICDNVDCGRCICSQCLERLIGEREPEKVSRCSPWHCNICEGRSAGRLQPRPDWEARVIEFFKNPQAVVPPVPDQLPRRSLHVLSLFDGIATGKYVLDQLGLSVEAYYASEVDKDAIHVGLTRHGSSIIYLGPVEHLKDQKLQELCPIDLLIGGSPCNDLANVNPNKKGLYDPTGTGILFFEFYRVLRTVLQANGGRHLFWMFENVVAMPREYRRVISRFLQCEPVLLDACSFSAQARARLFWGNIPGMHMSLNPELVQRTSLQSILHPLLRRKAAVAKVRTLTTNANSLRQSKHGLLPVIMDGEGDVLWATELEELFGFPKHYTDVGNISLGKRRQLLGKAWSVPVVCHILRPLRSFFLHSQATASS
nr:DNA (cytosine-5)-methyltransferase 3B-like [Rhipicephalus microplus]